MADEIEIRMDEYGHQANNANCVWSQANISPNTHMASGWLMRSSETADLNIALPVPIPTTINGTPAGKLVVQWITSSSDTSTTVTFNCYLSDIQINTDVVNPTTFDQANASLADTSNGAAILNEAVLNISGPSLTAGRGLRGIVRRVGSVFDVYVTGVFFRADKA